MGSKMVLIRTALELPFQGEGVRGERGEGERERERHGISIYPLIDIREGFSIHFVSASFKGLPLTQTRHTI